MTTQERASQISQKEALKIVVHLQVVLKLGKFYEPNNRILQEQMETLYSSMQTALEREDEIQIYVSQNSISLNRVRVKFDFATYHASKFLLSAFQEREIGSLIFYLGLTKEELTKFMFFLAEREIPKEDQFEQIFSDFEAASFPHILIEKIPPAEKVETMDKAIVTMYFLGIYHLKEIFEQEDEALNLNLTKRWVQSMFNHLAFDESFLFGLTNVKNFDEYTLNHSVNVCLLAIALGRRLGLSRPELMELGVSALLHDLGKLEIPKDILDKPAKLDTVETTRYFVRGLVELPAGVQLGHDDLRGRYPFGRMQPDRDATTIVLDGDARVDVDPDRNACALTSKGFVDRVVHHFEHEMVETSLARVADVHARALANGLEPFEHFDVLGAVHGDGLGCAQSTSEKQFGWSSDSSR